MKLFILLIAIVAFCLGYMVGYQHAYKPLHDKLQALQAEDWQHYLPQAK